MSKTSPPVPRAVMLPHTSRPTMPLWWPTRALAVRSDRVSFILTTRATAVVNPWQPYCLRPWGGATVSTPLKWSEVRRDLDPSRFNIKTLPKRLDKHGDLWEPVLGEGVDL